MADLKGTNIAAPLVPFTDQDLYPTHDALYGRGGWREVETTEERDAIPASRLRNGCVCYVEETGLPYLYKNGGWEELAVGGGDGATGGVTMRLRSTIGAMLSTLAGTEALIGFNFTSEYSDDGSSTGQGMAVYRVNSVQVATRVVNQGDTNFDVAEYLVKGANNVVVTVTDSAGNSRSLTYTVEVIELSLSSTFDDTRNFDGAITYTYIPMGALTKTIHFILDGQEIHSVTTDISNRQQSYSIPAQKHGSHTLSVFITASVNGMNVESNELFYDLICIEPGNNTPVIACSFHQEEVAQYTTLNIPYRVYDPQSTITAVTLYEMGKEFARLEVDRTAQVWNYRVTQPYACTLRMTCRTVSKEIQFNVSQSAITSTAVEEDLELYLTSQGRSNSAVDRATWKYGGITALMNGFNWTTNGWVIEENGNTSLRVSAGAEVLIPLHIFANDFRATGKTIEFEFSTRDVEDYDAVVVECRDGNRGLYITAQKAVFISEQTRVETQFKEEERVRIAFVIEEKTAQRLIYTYINGVISGVEQYPEDDNFEQQNPVGIRIGHTKAVIDLYNIRVYHNNLNPYQMLDNYIADMDDVDKKLSLFTKNQVYNAYGDIMLSLVLEQIPGLVITGNLPQYKGDKKIVSVSYTNLQDPSKSFTASGVQIDVQGTSSQFYPRKNYKMSFKSGLTLISTGESVTKYAHTDQAIPVNCFCFKADFAESSSTHNTGMARLIEQLLKDMGLHTPPQLENDSVRNTVEGFPMTIFHRHTEADEITFLGKYNFNNDKSTMETFGFTEGCESWELQNNTSDRVIFKKSDFTTDDWLNDFEGRYPDENEDYTNLKRLTDWIASTDGNPEKFKAEVKQYFHLENILAYYLITEVFGMVDQRAKNMFLTTFDGGTTWMMIFYDNDTCLGVNNEGMVAFDYDIEYHDTEGTQNVFNGEQSVLWNNVETCFHSEIATMYEQIRGNGHLTPEKVLKVLNEEQSEKWCEAIYNADTQFKYIDPLIEEGNGSYLYAAQGSREEHRKWWVYNRFRYMDSKYIAGDFKNDFVGMRLYTPTNPTGVVPNADFTLIPYANQYCQVAYGSYTFSERAKKDIPVTIKAPDIRFNDTETQIFGAGQLISIGDLAPKYPGTVDVSSATRLTELIIGSGVNGYRNTNLTTLSLGNNKMLKKLDIRNCPNLTQNLNLSQCLNIEEIEAEGSSITSITLAEGGNLRIMHLPDTITNLTIRNQPNLNESGFRINGTGKLSTLRIENTPGIHTTKLISECLSLSTTVLERVRLLGVNETEGTVEMLLKLCDLRGIDEQGNTTSVAVLTGKYHVPRIDVFALERFRTAFPELEITYDVSFEPKVHLTFVGKSGKDISGGILTTNIESRYVQKLSDNHVYQIIAPLLSTIEYTFLSDNYAPQTGEIPVRETEEGISYERVELTYMPLRTIRVMGKNMPVAGATVEVNGKEMESKTNASGQVSLRSNESLKVTAGGLLNYSSETVTYPVVQEDTVHILELLPKTKVTIQVRSNLGSALSGATVICNGQTILTDSTGEAVYYFYPENTYTYSVSYSDKYEVGSLTVGEEDILIPINFEMQIEDMQPAENGRIQFIYKPEGNWASGIVLTTTEPVTIHWGDGTSSVHSSGTATHNYTPFSINYSVEIENAQAVTSFSFSTTAGIIALWSMGDSIAPISTLFGNYGITNLVALGRNIFKNDAARTSGPVIGKRIRKIPEGLFDYFTEVTEFNKTFEENSVLYSVPVNLFDKCKKAKNFGRTFYHCSGIVTEVPRIWELVGDPDGTNNAIAKSNCYSGCVNALNFAEIPNSWK